MGMIMDDHGFVYNVKDGEVKREVLFEVEWLDLDVRDRK